MFRPPVTIDGEHVKLTAWTAADAEPSLLLVTSAANHLREYMPWVDGFNAAQNRNYLQQCEQNWNEGISYQFAIRYQRDLVGSCGITVREGATIMEIGYWIHQDYTGKGLVMDAVRCVIRAAFSLPLTSAVEIVHDARNLASEHIPRRLGFARLGSRKSEPPHPPGDSGKEVIWRMTRSSAVPLLMRQL
ncbi:GNAT family N-acetyltransferase [Streptomyces cinereoruber]|uniref:GNAT family N-acetyltransferase n=1 Tax=Streptomyces cinereoruber TaxID=67260 RepID=UPI003627DA27